MPRGHLMPTSLPLPPNLPSALSSSLRALSNFRAAQAPPIEPSGVAPDLLTYWQARYPRYQLAPHIRLMLEELNNLQDGEALIITMPPRHSKSESVKAWLEWSLGQHPQDEAILASYAIDLARRHSRSIRNEIAGHGSGAFGRFFPGVQLAADSAAASDWALAQGGRFKAAGVGVGITGMGARFGVIDDPFKDRKQAESETVRETVWEWFTSAFLTRLTPDARIVVMHTRWHEDDLVGRIQSRLEDGDTDELGGLTWRVLNLPAFAEENDPLGRELDAPLWPERYDRKRLEGIRDTNPYDFAALYQQRPTNRGGTVFMEPATYTEPIEGRVYLTVDTASSKRETADFSVLTAWSVDGYGSHLTADVLECARRRMSITEFAAVARDMQQRYGVPLHIEDAGLAKPIIQYLQSEGLAVIPVKVAGDKFTRAQPYAAAWNQGRVRLPASNPPWLPAFKAEHLAFTGTPTDKHDDQCFVAGTLIETESGPVPIEQIRAGDKVLTRQGYRPVILAGQTSDSAKIYALETSDGRHLFGTANHPIFTVERGFIPLCHLRKDDMLSICASINELGSESHTTGYTSTGILSPHASLTRGISPLEYLAEPKELIFSIGRYGRTTLAQFQKAWKSIIKTATRQITHWTTLSASPALSTWSYTPQTWPATTLALSSKLTLSESVPKLLSGIAARKDANGIGKMQRLAFALENFSPSLAKCAEWFLKAFNLSKLFSAQRSALRNSGVWTARPETLQRFAPSVTRNIWAQKPRKPAHVHVRRIYETGRREAVYNLSVADVHEYFANGVLVHNCDTGSLLWQVLSAPTPQFRMFAT